MSRESACHVYIMAHSEDGYLRGPVKIGIAKTPWSRLSGVQTGNPKPLQVAAWFPFPDRRVAREIEAAFHSVKASRRMQGEWFDMGVVDAITAMCANIRVCVEATCPEDIRGKVLEMTGVTEREANLSLHSRGGESLQ